MYYYLHGTVTMHLKEAIVIECHGVGYQVLVSHPYDYEIGATVRVYTAFYAREDTQFLLGFATFAEKAVYDRLTTVKGVGPRTAMMILGGSSVERIKKAIDEADVLFLKRLPNVGPKTASQIVLDLQGKLTLTGGLASGDKNLDDALIGLKNMGFTGEEIALIVADLPRANLSTEEYLKRALTLWGQRRQG